MTDKREGLEAVIAVGSQWMERAIAAEQLAGLATWLYEQLPIGVDLTEFRAKYRALTSQAPEADHVGGLMSIPVYKAPEQAHIAALERQLERHATLLHNSHHNWALHSVADCPELECEEYRALLSPAPEGK